ncbi:MAG TPA: serine/threonine-protein kinase [Gemmatimonadales bacterium]|nr:serine/threonine-protein kinase [Gemmatimonadales bacterium]
MPRIRVSADDAPRPSAEDSQRLGSLTGTTLDDRYRIGRKVGEGGMSWVYQAEDTQSGRTVAIKLLPPRLARDRSAVERLRREAEIADRFEHPNVCPILAFGYTGDGALYLVMPFLEGETLSDYELRTRAVSVADGVRILSQVCRGLQHAHDLGVIHRDLKPENVMLVTEDAGLGTRDSQRPRPASRAVVMDFGLAKQRRAGAEVVKLTQTGIVLGTPEFMSPEQIRGRPLDGRSDIYAVGVLAFELFTGELPFTGKNAQETMMARLRGLPRRLRDLRPDLPARLESVIARALALAPEERYQSMNEFADALDRLAAGGPISRLFRRRQQ